LGYIEKSKSLMSFKQFLLESKTKVNSYVKLAGPGGSVELFNVEYDGTSHLIEVISGSGLSYQAVSSGKTVPSDMKGLIKKYEDVDRYKIETTKMDPKTRGLITYIMDHSHELNLGLENPLKNDFIKILTREISHWTGSYSKGSQGIDKITAVRHPYYKTYRKDYDQALKKEKGSTITLYRGVYGDIVDEIEEKKSLPIHKFSSWTGDREHARNVAKYDKPKGEKKYTVITKKFKPSEILISPIQIEDFEHITDGLKREDEYIVISKTKRIKI